MKKFYSWYKKHMTAAIFTGLIFECRTVPLSFVSYESHGKASSDVGE